MPVDGQLSVWNTHLSFLPPTMSVALELATDAKHPPDVLRDEDVGYEKSRHLTFKLSSHDISFTSK